MELIPPCEIEGLDPKIKDIVAILRNEGIETFESCDGGTNHPFLEPTIRFHGGRSEGFRALAISMQNGLNVSELRRSWCINDGEPAGPFWEITFVLRP